MHLTLILYAADDVRHRAQRSSQYSKYFNKSNWNGRKKSLDNKPAIWFQWRYKNKMKEKCSLKNLTVYRARVVIMGTLNQSCAWNAIRMQIGIFSIFYLPFNVCCCCHFALYLLHFFVIFALLHLEQQEIYESNLLRNMSTCRLADPKREPVTKNEMHTNWNIIYTVALGKRTFCWIYFIAGEFIFKFCQIVFFSMCIYNGNFLLRSLPRLWLFFMPTVLPFTSNFIRTYSIVFPPTVRMQKLFHRINTS